MAGDSGPADQRDVEAIRARPVRLQWGIRQVNAWPHFAD